MLRLFSHSVSGWLVGLLISGLVFIGMDYRLASEQAESARCLARESRLETDITQLASALHQQNVAVLNLQRRAQQLAADADTRAVRVLRLYDKPPTHTNGPEELNRWLHDIFSAPSHYHARDAPLKSSPGLKP